MKNYAIYTVMCLLLLGSDGRDAVKAQTVTRILQSDVEKVWQKARQMAYDGDSLNAVAEMKRAEDISVKRFRKTAERCEWMNIKAELYAFSLNRLEDACNTQMDVVELLMKHDDEMNGELLEALRRLHNYEFFLGEFQLAYGAALMNYAEHPADKKSGAGILDECLLRSCRALRNYKEGLGYATRMLKQEYERYAAEQPENQKYAFFTLEKYADYKIVFDLDLGYTDDAQKTMAWMDGLADELTRRAKNRWDAMPHDLYLLFARARLLTELGQHDQAMEVLKQYRPGERISLLDNMDKFDDLNYHLLKARLYKETGRTDEGVEELAEAAASIARVNANHPFMSEILCELADLLAAKGKYPAAMNVLVKARQILLKCEMRRTPYFSDVMQRAARYAYQQGVLKQLWPRWVLEVTRERLSELRNAFTECNMNERIHVWNHGKYKEWFQDFLPEMVSEDLDLMANDTLIGCMYAGMQMSKRILFDSEHRMRQLVMQDQSGKLGDDYRRLMQLKRELLQSGTMTGREYGETKSRIYDLEEKITWELNLDKDKPFKMNMGIANAYVKQLETGEVYLDFYRYRDMDGVTKYGASTALEVNGEKCVLALKLFDEKMLKEVYSNGKYEAGQLYDLIWQNLDYMFRKTGTRKVYFSAAGELHNLAIEYVPDRNGRLISDKYEMYRVMSTRETILNKGKRRRSTLKKLSVWGNMDFAQYGKHPAFGTMGRRLDFSKLEMEGIRGLTPKGVDCRTYENAAATESRFKAEAEHSGEILHIATHGFYLDADSRKEWLNGGQLDWDVFSPLTKGSLTVEDEKMMNSVLLMTGEAGKTEEDGILTAAEIALLDLSHLDLVVLSACRSGLGDLSDEGTLGLLRAFKKAGARSMLISLKAVDDESTCLLMQAFYRHLFAGKSKHEALERAQQELRTMAGGRYADPRYWAPFILVDAIDQ